MALVVQKSNRLEELFTVLAEQLYSSELPPLALRSVVVPSPAMRWWVQLQLAEKYGVCSGIEWLYLDEIPTRFYEGERPPSTVQQSFAIETWLHQQQICPEKNAPALAEQMVGLFRRYGLFGRALVKEWTPASPDWQQRLWCTLREFWEDSGQVWERQPCADLHGSLHLFGVSFLGATQLAGLQRLAEKMPLYLYQLSPTPYFWGDIASDLESEKLQLRSERQGTSLPVRERLEELLLDRNRLLGNCGRVGREFANLLVDLDIDAEEYFQPPEEETLLGVLQQDLLEITSPRSVPLCVLGEGDHSIELHHSCSPLREVEALHDRLLHFIHCEGISSSDIVVMAPDITPYAPYLKMVFGDGKEGLTLRILDLPLQTESSVVHGFRLLLQLATSRWESTSLLELLACEAFRSAVGIDLQHVAEVRRWLQERRIRWGFDEEHRRKELAKGDLEDPALGTWAFGLDQLIDNQLVGEDPALDSGELGRFVALLYDLREDLAPLASGEALPLSEWVEYLHILLDSYFQSESDRSIEKLHSLLERFRVDLPFGEQRFPFASVQERVFGAIDRESCGWREWAAEGVRCCSLLPMRAVPAEVVCLLGLSDGAYPRTERRNPHDRLQGAKREYDPDRNDFDRYLFLEALLSARRHLLLSYSTTSTEGDEQGPSLLLRELFDYCDSRFRLGEKPPSEACRYTHPSSPFSARYFSPDSPLPSYAPHRYRGAVLRQEKPRPPYRTIDRWLSPFDFNEREELYTLADLLAVARHPIRFFLREGLDLYLAPDEEIDAADSFSLSALEFSVLCREALVSSPEQVIASADQKGVLPPGPFRTVAVQRLTEQITAQKELYGDLELFSIELRSDCTAPFYQEGEWILPALEVGESTIVGVFRDLTAQGIVLGGKKPEITLLRAWPVILLQTLLAAQKNSPFDEAAIRMPPERAEEYLKRYLAYCSAARKAPSPLLPEWIPDIMRGAPDRLSTTFAGMRERYHDPYLAWAFATEEPPFEQIVDEWREGAEMLLGGIHDLI